MTTTTTRPSDRRPGLALRAVLAVAVAAGAVQPLGAAAAFATPPSHPAAAPNATKATFGIGAARNGKPDPYRPYFNFGVTSGAHVNDQIVINNYARTRLTLNVYATDALNAANGDFALLGQGIRPTDAGTWITIGGTRGGIVSLAPRSSVVLPIRVSVPAGATPGDHTAGIIASLGTVSKDRNGAAVRLLQRVGVRMFFRVGGVLHPGLSVQRLRAHYVNNWNPLGHGSAIVTYRLTNTGNVRLGARQQVWTHGLFGSSSRVSPGALLLLLPGGHVDYRVVVPGVLPAISLNASVRVSPVTVLGDVQAAVHTTTTSRHFWAVPWILLGIVLLLLAAGGTWWWRGRRAARRPATPSPSQTEGAPVHDTASSR